MPFDICRMYTLESDIKCNEKNKLTKKEKKHQTRNVRKNLKHFLGGSSGLFSFSSVVDRRWKKRRYICLYIYVYICIYMANEMCLQLNRKREGTRIHLSHSLEHAGKKLNSRNGIDLWAGNNNCFTKSIPCFRTRKKHVSKNL